MTRPSGFPWVPALAGTALLLVSLTTVRVRGEAVCAGYAIARAEQACQALNRRLAALQLNFQDLHRRLGETGAARL